MTDKPTNAIRGAIEEIKNAQAAQAEIIALTDTEIERGTVLSSPANMQGSVSNAITAALLSTQMAVTALEQAGRDIFPRGRNLYFDKDLEGLPFMVVSPPRREEVVNNFRPSEMVNHVMFQAWLLDETHILTNGYDATGVPIVTGYDGPQPKTVDVELAGGFVQNTFFELPDALVLGRVWTLALHPTIKIEKGQKKGDPARMISFWKPSSIEKQGTF